MVSRFFASALAVAVVFFGVALAAPATAYVPEGRISINPASVSPGGVVTVTASEGSFAPSEPVRVAVNGYAATQAALGLLVRASAVQAPQVETTSITGTASASGALAAQITAPEEGRGTYTVDLVGLDSGRLYSAAFSVTPAATGGSSGPGGALPNTGVEAYTLVGLAGIGVAGIVAGLIAAAARRRQGASTASR